MIKAIPLNELVSRYGGHVANAAVNSYGEQVAIRSVSTDTRQIKTGDTFVALKGDNFDAHHFLSTAQESGATLLVVDTLDDQVSIPQWQVVDTTKALGDIARYHREQFAGKVVAITGSGGKTTVKGMLYDILQLASQQRTFATKGNLNNHIGVPLSLLSLESQHDYAVIEMGASAVGEIDYLTSLGQPHVALINNVMPAHVEGFGSVDNIAKAKGEIYNGLVEGGIAIINADDDYANQWLQQNRQRNIMTFSVDDKRPTEAGRHILAANQQLAKNGSPQFDLINNNQKYSVTLNVLGTHNIANALAAATCAFALNIDAQHIVNGLQQFTGVAGRLERVAGQLGSQIIDDSYNANPGSVKAAIDVLADFSAKKVLVIGDMGELGDMAETAHIAVGRYANEKNIDYVLSLGELAVHASRAFEGQSQHFDNVDQLVAYAQSIRMITPFF